MDRKRLIAIITVVTLIIAGIGVGMWRSRHHDTAARATPTVQATTRRATPTATPTATISAQDAATLATQFEHAARDWGADPNAAVTDNAALAAQRVPDRLDRTAFTNISTITPNEINADSPSQTCTEDPTAATCTSQPTRLAYWRANWYQLGARLTTTPTTRINTDGTLTTTGKITLIAWANTSNVVTIPGYWGYSPRTWTLTYTDTLTIHDNKITAWRTNQNGWLAAPMTGDWSEDPLTQIPDTSTQTNTPIPGTPPTLDLNPDPGLPVMANSQDMTSETWTSLLSQVAPGQSDGQGNEQSDSQRLTEQQVQEMFGDSDD